MTATKRGFLKDAMEDAVNHARLNRGPEYNAPATILTWCKALEDDFLSPSDFTATKAMRNIETAANVVMLQLGLLREGFDVSSVFLNKAEAQGWRFKPTKGFYLKEANENASSTDG